MSYRFKYIYKDGTSEISGAKSGKPEGLFFDFDGLMNWDEYYELYDKNLTTKEVLKLALKYYEDYFKKDFKRIEIINDETNKVIDYIEKNDE